MKLIFGKKEIIEKRTAKIIAIETLKILKKQKYAIIGISGGRTIPNILRKLKNINLPWKRIHIFLTDENLVPITSRQSNYRLVSSFLEDIPEKNIHDFNSQESASDYYKKLKNLKGKFDIVLLSSGKNGEIASLFPNHKSIKSTHSGYIEIKDSPIYPKERISATSSLIRKSKVSILLFIGNEKKEAYENFINPRINFIDCPAKIVNTIQKSYVLTDIN